ncbi:hypothetical protein [Paraliomyxa miuraensis]|uniref:hypothetical protein n=1 Tax=Paraliomyxa miuraensis TaxID=376150 RepID=UPI00225A8770|nr:hypothetical protein [Paraliomyxa miuraensis]MCX4241564.1 hypothetical protein [Paraliomyxa miuraensis]
MNKDVIHHLLLTMLIAAGCGSDFETFTAERERLACEIDEACGAEGLMCDEVSGYAKDDCVRYRPSKADECLEALEARLAEIEADAATCDPGWTWPDACSDADEWVSHRQGCNAVAGRPLQHEGQWVLAEVTRGRHWSRATAALAADRDTNRRHAAARWLELARAEHASVAAFSRASLELMTLGAPPHLLEGCHRAALDEIAHARLALDLARTLGDLDDEEAWDLGPLPAVPWRSVTLEQVAIDALLEGCLGEGAAAAAAQVATARATGRAVEVSETIAEDETRHAALAWATLRWALQRDRALAEPLADAFALALAERRARVRQTPTPEPDVAIHGLLDAAELARIELDVAERVVAPVLTRLLSRAHDDREPHAADPRGEALQPRIG